MPSKKSGHAQRIEGTLYVIRIGEAGWVYGLDYEIWTVVIDKGEGIAEVQGLDKTPSLGHLVECCRLMWCEGFKVLRYERRDRVAGVSLGWTEYPLDQMSERFKWRRRDR